MAPVPPPPPPLKYPQFLYGQARPGFSTSGGAVVRVLNPVINNLHQSLYLKDRQTFSNPGRAVNKPGFYGNQVATVFDFFEASYRKTIEVVSLAQKAIEPGSLNGPRVGYDHSFYTPNKNSYGLLMSAFTIAPQREWDAFQYMMDKAFFILKPTNLLPNLSVADQTLLLERAGLVQFSATITASDNTVIATGLVPGINFINAWNNLLVPYQASINEPVYYITSISGQNPADTFYRKTGNRKAKVHVTFPI